MADGKKMGAILALIGKPEKKPKEDDGPSSREVAAQAVLDAIEAKDAKMLADAMQSSYDACAMHGGEDDYDDESA